MSQQNQRKYDVIIFGAGIAGLFAGCYLAKQGLKCAILEAHYVPGGCAQGFSRNGYYFDAGAHLIGSSNEKAILGRLLKNIEINYNFVDVNPTDRIHFPDRAVLIPQGWKKYKNNLCINYPDDTTSIIRFLDEMEYIAKYAANDQVAKKYGPMSFSDFLDSHITNNELKIIFGSQWGFLGEPPQNLSALAMSIMLVSYIRDGAKYPKGGAQRFCNVLANRFRSYGGKIFLSNRISNLMVIGDRLCGVNTDKNIGYEAEMFISTINPKIVYEMANRNGGRDLKQELYKTLQRINNSISIYAVYLGLNKSPESLYGVNGWHYSSYDIKKNDSWLYVFSPTTYDKKLAPKGRSTLEAAFIYEPQLFSNQSDTRIRKTLKAKMLRQLSAIVPNIESSIEVFEDGLPDTFIKYTNNPNGSIYGWAPRADNFDDRDYVSKNPIFINMLQAGHWTSPGPGVPAVAISGYLAAKKIKENVMSAGVAA